MNKVNKDFSEIDIQTNVSTDTLDKDWLITSSPGGFEDDYGEETVMLSEDELAKLSEDDEKDYWWYCPPLDHNRGNPIDQFYGNDIVQNFRKKLDNDNFCLLDIPKNIDRIISVISNSEFDFSEVSALVSESPVLMADFLKIANSALHTRSEINDVRVILPRLGLTIVKSVLYLNSLKFSLASQPIFRELATEIVNHSRVVAVIAQYISRGWYHRPDNAFIAGLLHDIGKLVILKELTIKYLALLKSMNTLSEDYFDQLFMEFHENFGDRMADSWNLDSDIRYAIAHHHQIEPNPPGLATEPKHRLAAVINISDQMARMLGYGKSISDVDLFSLPACERLGIEKNAETIDRFQKIPMVVDLNFEESGW